MNVLITGASRGIGRALALGFGRAGHSVGVNYKARHADAESVLAELQGMGARAELFQADVSDPLQAQALWTARFKSGAAWTDSSTTPASPGTGPS
ncbi:MAG: SDR family NAD(P)-dependent oxidoreductase [Elusimicrobia bacterium]|nr:SDR family NAD(P)-dependent oxidoreductase [Elusimicrobiota bacterium]